jgi:pyrroloquinoline quinone biosynthesis protein D
VNSLALPRILDLTPALSPMYRLQFESAQDSWVLLYPEGMVRLNGPASEILRLCDGQRSVRQMVDELQQRFGESDLRGDVCDFVSDAHERGCIV